MFFELRLENGRKSAKNILKIQEFNRNQLNKKLKICKLKQLWF